MSETSMAFMIAMSMVTGCGRYGTYSTEVDRKELRLKQGLLPVGKSHQEPHEKFR